MKARIYLSIAATLTACALETEDDATSEIESEATVVIERAYVWPAAGSSYYVSGLSGGTQCDDGTYATRCLADALDFSMSGLTTAQITDLRAKLAAGTANLADTTAIVTGQWRVVTVRDHRDPPREYRRIDLQVLSAHTTSMKGPHLATYYQLSGTTAQRAQRVSGGPHSLPFWATVEFPEPVLANSYGVVSDGFVTGTIAEPPTSPARIVADRYFRRL